MTRLMSGHYNSLHGADPFNREMVSFGPSQPLEGARYTRIYDGGVAVTDISGPIYRHASDTGSGEKSTSMVARDIVVTEKSDAVHSRLMVMDTPGGEATGGDEVAQRIYESRSVKPIETYIEGLGASLGYYWAAASSVITASQMALVGSIGVVMGVPLPSGILPVPATAEGEEAIETPEVMVHEDRYGNFIAEFVSSKSPMKRANPTTKRGRAYYHNIVNACADIFVRDVAMFRNVDPNALPGLYGDGGVSPGTQALNMGLVDAIGTFESVIERMARDYWKPKGQTTTGSGASQSAATQTDPAGVAGNKGVTNRKEDEDMSILDRLNKDKGKTPTTNTETQGQPQTPGQRTTADILAEIEKQRPGLIARLEDRAILRATQLLNDKRFVPAVQDLVAYRYLNAACDDALYGGQSVFVKDEKEVMGTRVEEFEAFFEAMPRHSMADERVESLRDGETQGAVLGQAKKTTPASVAEPGDYGKETMSNDELLKLSSLGERAIENRDNGKAATR